MDINLSTTSAEAAAAINGDSATPVKVQAAPTVADPRLESLKAAAAALIPAAGLNDEDTVEVSLAMSDEPGWAVVRVARVIRAE